MAFSDYWRGDRDRNREEWRSNEREWDSPERERTPQGEGFQRRGWREGSDYYGNRPERYGAGNYDEFADRNYANEQRSFGGGTDRGGRGGADWNEDRYGAHGSSFNDRWQNSYRGPNPRAYVGYSGYGGGDYGEHDYDQDYGGSLFTGGGNDRMRAFDEERAPFGHREGQFRGRGPKGYRRSDERIREDVCECLTDDDRVDASNIDVSVKDCEVTLTGTVTSREQKRRAEEAIDYLAGVKDVHNQLRVVEEARAVQNGPTGKGSAGDRARTSSRH